MPVSNLTTWLMFWLLEARLNSLFRVCSEACSWAPLLPSKLILTDWPRGQTPHFISLLSWATRLHHPSVWFVITNLQTTHLSGQGWNCPGPIFWACDTCGSLNCMQLKSNTQIFLCVLFWKWSAVIFNIFSPNIFFLFTLTNSPSINHWFRGDWHYDE